MSETPPIKKQTPHPLMPFRRAVFRGLAIVMPLLLTIALFFWAWTLVERYVLVPVEAVAHTIVTWSTQDIVAKPLVPKDDGRAILDDKGEIVSFEYDRRLYSRRANGKWVGVFPEDYVQTNFLRRSRVLPFFISSFVVVLYLLGKFVAAGVGRFFVHAGEALIHRVPVVNSVYSSVKQVTDYVFSEREFEFNHVVVVEYPRLGIWSLGFITGDSLREIRDRTGEPMVSIFIPTSPAPFTGYTITMAKKDVYDVNVSIDQAIKFIVSGGVVAPPLDGPRSLLLPADRGNGTRLGGPLTPGGPAAPDGAATVAGGTTTPTEQRHATG